MKTSIKEQIVEYLKINLNLRHKKSLDLVRRVGWSGTQVGLTSQTVAGIVLVPTVIFHNTQNNHHHAALMSFDTTQITLVPQLSVTMDEIS